MFGKQLGTDPCSYLQALKNRAQGSQIEKGLDNETFVSVSLPSHTAFVLLPYMT
jgi:hypothetical protein